MRRDRGIHDKSPNGDFLEDEITQTEAAGIFSRLLVEPDHSDNETALQRLGSLIDLSEMLNRPDGVEKALKMGDALFSRDLNASQTAVLHYLS